MVTKKTVDEDPVDLVALQKSKNKKTAVHPSRLGGAPAEPEGFKPDATAVVIAEPVRIFLGK